MFRWFHKLSKRTRDSIRYSATIVGGISTLLSIAGLSLGDFDGLKIWMRIIIVIVAFALLSTILYLAIGKMYKSSVSLKVRSTPVKICYGNIFKESGMKVIGCDTHFDVRVDDVIISKKSLQGQLVLECGNPDEIKLAVEKAAKRLNLQKNSDGFYDFPLGSIVRYESGKDHNIYLMLAMTELNDNHESHTNMARYEQMLMKMWREIDRVYASHDILLPVLGSGISRFDDGPKDNQALLKCMLCTLNSSGVSLNAKVKIMLYGNTEDVALYEYKDLFSASY